MGLVHVHRFPNKHPPKNAIYPNEIVGAAPVCPPERSRSGVSIREMGFCASRIVRGDLTMDAPLWGDASGHTGTAPTNPRNIFRRNSTQTKEPFTCKPPLPISTKPRGVSLPHQGYTFDSAGLASATQPTLGNDASEEATPLGVVLFLIAHHYHTVPNE